jgi:hypothetical protein
MPRFNDQHKWIDNQQKFYELEGYKYDNEFSWNMVLARADTPGNKECNELRRNMIIEYCYRDMLSMEYAIRNVIHQENQGVTKAWNI